MISNNFISSPITPGRSHGGWRLLGRLALQNMGRRPTRTALLVLSVALGTGAIFSGLTVGRGMAGSMEAGFARMGADLIVLPKDTLVNLTSALLTVEPSDHLLDARAVDQVAYISGVEAAAPQRLYRIASSKDGHAHESNLIAFDPARDFTVQPWIRERLDRPMAVGDVLVGGRRDESLGDRISIGAQILTVYARLERTGVGPFDYSAFTTFDSVDALAKGGAPLADHDPSQVSALLVRLRVGATAEQVRFAIAKIAGVKVAVGGTVVTSTRQGLSALFGGMAFFAAGMLLGFGIMVCVLFSAIVAERRREIGLLRAMGARCRQIVHVFAAEAALTTGLGGVCGILLGAGVLLTFQRSLVYYFKTVNVAFAWPSWTFIAVLAAACAAWSALVGLIGAFVPASRAGRCDPYDLIQSEGK